MTLPKPLIPVYGRAYVVHKKGLQGAARVAFGKEVQTWVQARVAKHKYLRGGMFMNRISCGHPLTMVRSGVIVLDAIPKR